jgi:hypothetical protein
MVLLVRLGVRVMWRFIVMTFICLGWSFYTLSGGADYEPREGSRQAEALKARAAAEAQVAQAPLAPANPVPTTPEAVTNLAEGPALAAAATIAAGPLPTQASPLPILQAGLADTRIADLTLAKSANLAQMAAPIPASLAIEPEPAQQPRDLRRITGDSVNMRSGPGTDYGILARVTRDTEVEVLEVFENGWLRIRVLDGSRIGWVSSRLVTPAPDRG